MEIQLKKEIINPKYKILTFKIRVMKQVQNQKDVFIFILSKAAKEFADIDFMQLTVQKPNNGDTIIFRPMKGGEFLYNTDVIYYAFLRYGIVPIFDNLVLRIQVYEKK